MSTSANISRRTSATLINRVKDLDDDDGWREFYDRYRGLVLNIGRQRGLTTAEAEEVGQEVFSRVARNIGLFETGGRPGAFRRWLGQLTMWCAIDAQRRRRLQTSPIQGDSGEEWSPDNNSNNNAAPVSLAGDTLAEVTDRDFKQLLLLRLRQIVSAKDFTIYHLISFDGWTPVQVAQHFGMRRGTVDTIICRTRQAARRELARIGEGLG
jgi:RNA polymerase sigma factor (sigma-70 family)